MKTCITQAVALNQLPVVFSCCTVFDTVEKEIHGTADRPLTILKSSIKSALLRLSSKDHNPNLSVSLHKAGLSDQEKVVLIDAGLILVKLSFIQRIPTGRTVFYSK